jgi:hypothetical protein
MEGGVRGPECGTLCCRHAGDGSSAPCGAELFLFWRCSRGAFAAPRRIRQSRSHHGASKASRTPECGTLCCRQRWMDALLHAVRSSSSFGGAVAEHLPLRAASGRAGATSARAERRALRSAARSSSFGGAVAEHSLLRTASGRAGATTARAELRALRCFARAELRFRSLCR